MWIIFRVFTSAFTKQQNKTVVICHSLLLMSYIMSPKDNKYDMVPYVTLL